MNEEIFWHIISLLDWDETGDDDAVLEPACAALAARSPDDICHFDDILAEKLFGLDTREHARACFAGEADPDNGNDYISADGFLYSRCVVVANGAGFYASVLADPSRMPQNMEFEALLSLASSAFERKAGKEYGHTTVVSYESFQNAQGWRPTPATKPGKFTSENIPPGNRRPT
jgi:hypothetical protein